MSVLVNALGTAAALCSMASFAPQLAKLLRTHDATGVSLRMFVITATGFGLWTGYGLVLQAWPLVASNLVCLVLSAAIAAAKVAFRKNPRAPARA